MNYVLKPIGYSRLCLKAEMKFCLHLTYTRVTASETYKESGQYPKQVYELGPRGQGVTGTVANWERTRVPFKGCKISLMCEHRPSVDPSIFQEKLEVGQLYVNQVKDVGWTELGPRNNRPSGGKCSHLGLQADHEAI